MVESYAVGGLSMGSWVNLGFCNFIARCPSQNPSFLQLPMNPYQGIEIVLPMREIRDCYKERRWRTSRGRLHIDIVTLVRYVSIVVSPYRYAVHKLSPFRLANVIAESNLTSEPREVSFLSLSLASTEIFCEILFYLVGFLVCQVKNLFRELDFDNESILVKRIFNSRFVVNLVDEGVYAPDAFLGSRNRRATASLVPNLLLRKTAK